MESYLNEEEARFIREEMAKRRPPGTYEEGKWSVSPWNRDLEAFQIAPGGFPKSVILRDITLHRPSEARRSHHRGGPHRSSRGPPGGRGTVPPDHVE